MNTKIMKNNQKLFENCLKNASINRFIIFSLYKNNSVCGKIILKQGKRIKNTYRYVFHCYIHLHNGEGKYIYNVDKDKYIYKSGESIYVHETISEFGFNSLLISALLDKGVLNNLESFKNIGLDIKGFNEKDKRTMMMQYCKNFFEHNGYKMERIV